MQTHDLENEIMTANLAACSAAFSAAHPRRQIDEAES
jgi:hypothetical protein